MDLQYPHIPNEDLLMALDGEQPGPRMAQIRTHLANCWECRARSLEIEEAIRDFVGVYGHNRRPLSRMDGPRALLKLRLKELGRKNEESGWTIPFLRWRVKYALPLIAVALVALPLLSSYSARLSSQKVSGTELRILPDPRLTPGAAKPVRLDELCESRNPGPVGPVSTALAHQAFDAYEVADRSPNRYEVDYLITPELGGLDDIRNVWPEPYTGTVWNSHVKDALEEYLRQLVCGRTLDLATAQHDIATDWVSAYKKYFRTNQPLQEHVAFLKDQPWE